MMSKSRSKNETINDDEELCVFGYEVKLFPNDSINNEGPCMIRLSFDDEIEVDRYDCRLLLHSFSQIGESRIKDDVPDFEEDYLCEEERYLDLEALENEQKPSTSTKNAEVAFSYEKTTPSPPSANIVSEEPFKTPKKQYYPSGMILPSTKKQALLIEKTATFVKEKGAEYESNIIEKASSNKNLIFLKSDDSLNAYYKYILSLMKDNIYVSIPTQDEPDEDDVALGSDDDYLSPLLLRKKRKQSTEVTVAPQPKKVAKKVITISSIKEENQIDKKAYFEWYQRFYNSPSPYFPNILPKLIKPPMLLVARIHGQAESVAQNGREQEKLFLDTDPLNTKHMHFTNPYYMFYQSHLYKKSSEIEKAKLELERQQMEAERKRIALEEGEIVDEALEPSEVNEEELQRQLERRQKAHFFLKTIFDQKKKEQQAANMETD